ncbi:hypothetical protein Ciccas_002813 [Cichlidogyrus casuarinus]|uniref:Uncharacterized protein n=1 Tax=Cichlidogyrus casuarinus TaxID=1844966 RepID=A0ABD2QG68_9PLAT
MVQVGNPELCGGSGNKVKCTLKEQKPGRIYSKAIEEFGEEDSAHLLTVMAISLNLLPFKTGLTGQIERLCRIPRCDIESYASQLIPIVYSVEIPIYFDQHPHIVALIFELIGAQNHELGDFKNKDYASSFVHLNTYLGQAQQTGTRLLCANKDLVQLLYDDKFYYCADGSHDKWLFYQALNCRKYLKGSSLNNALGIIVHYHFAK